MVVATITTPLTRNGTYAVVLSNAITDGQGRPVVGGGMKIMSFTLDTAAPCVTADVRAMSDGTVVMTGEVDDPEAVVEVLADQNAFTARSNGDGTWMLPADLIDPPPAGGMSDLVVIATDAAGNVDDRCKDTCDLVLSSTAGGSIDVPGEGTFSYECQEEEIEIVAAMADVGHRFVRWEGTAWDAGKVTVIDQDDSGSMAEVLVDAPYTLQAVFEPQCCLTLDVVGEGTIDPNIGVHYYACNTKVQVCAEPAAGSRFVGWEGTAVTEGKVEAGAGESCVLVTVDSPGDCYTLTAVFEAQCCLTLDVIGEGTIDPEVGVHYYACGAQVQVRARPDAGRQFLHWEGTAVTAGKVETGADASCVLVTVDDPGDCYTLTAVFETLIYDDSLDADPGWVLEEQWEFGIPTGQRRSGWGNVDPTGGYTGTHVIGVNMEGCYDLIVGGPYYATAGPFDLSGYTDVRLVFRRWLNTDIPEYVRNFVEVSTDGQTWSTIWGQAEREEITDTEWTLCEYRLTSADLQPTVYVRWSYEVVQERAYAYTSWDVDDIQWIGVSQ